MEIVYQQCRWTARLLNKLWHSSEKYLCTKYHLDRALPATKAVCIGPLPSPPCTRRHGNAYNAALELLSAPHCDEGGS